ncbi:MAG: GntR family transcriptional regulator [Anaerolineales bacterium]|nr:GntR family transcriptional regulator [Anaerolineales bacterium]MDW8162935.1 GntR family transcriptional regulator [Anaerolineales bacterium]
MTSIDLNTNSSVPLYIQLKEILARKIRLGELKPHDRLPSERELCRQYGISRMTVRQALQMLVQEGILYTAVGKGTFVSEVIFEQDHALTGFTEQMKRANLTASSKVLEATVIAAAGRIAEKLEIPLSSGVILLKRLRLGNGEPIAVETAHIPHNLFANLLQYDFSKMSLYEIFRRVYGVIPMSARQSVEAALATPKEAQMLKLNLPAAVLRIERITRDQNENVIEYVESVYRGDRYKFHALLKAEFL